MRCTRACCARESRCRSARAARGRAGPGAAALRRPRRPRARARREYCRRRGACGPHATRWCGRLCIRAGSLNFMYTSSDTCTAAPRPLLAALRRTRRSHNTRDGPSWTTCHTCQHAARLCSARAAVQRAERGQRHGAWGGLLLHVKQREHKMHCGCGHKRERARAASRTRRQTCRPAGAAAEARRPSQRAREPARQRPARREKDVRR